jgi:hypothetical protein
VIKGIVSFAGVIGFIAVIAWGAYLLYLTGYAFVSLWRRLQALKKKDGQ